MTKIYDLSNLKIFFNTVDFDDLWIHFHPMRSSRGRQAEFTWKMLLKATILQWKLRLASDVDLSSYFQNNSDAVKLCGMPRAPSHDVLSKFAKKYYSRFGKLHSWLDKKLEDMGLFIDDSLAGDGTNVPLHKPQKDTDDMKFGAKSNLEKFYGLWLMLLVSTNTGLVRAFNFADARVGQVKLMMDLLTSGMISKGSYIFLDGIFDGKDIYSAVTFDQESIPIIPYNPKNAKIKLIEHLPDDDWRGEYNSQFKNYSFFTSEYYKRVTVERTNSHVKMNTILKEIYERSRRLPNKSDHQINKNIYGAIITTQIDKFVEEINSKKQITLNSYTLKTELMA